MHSCLCRKRGEHGVINSISDRLAAEFGNKRSSYVLFKEKITQILLCGGQILRSFFVCGKTFYQILYKAYIVFGRFSDSKIFVHWKSSCLIFLKGFIYPLRSASFISSG